MRKCVLCPRSLKTGIKYCYVHRSLQKEKVVRKKEGFDIQKMIVVVIVSAYFFIASFFIEGDFKGLFRISSILVGVPVLIGLLVELSTRARKKNEST